MKISSLVTEFKSRMAKSEGRYLAELLRQHCLDNPHRLDATMTPDTALLEEEAAEERRKLDAMAAALSEEDKRRVVEQAAALVAMQARPSPFLYRDYHMLP